MGNPFDAAIAAYTGMSLLRQQMKPTWRVHGIIKGEDNPIGYCSSSATSDEVTLDFYLRAPTDGELKVLREKGEAVFYAAGAACGCSVRIVDQTRYSSLLSNRELVRKYVSNCELIGFALRDPGSATVGHGSTDMGNVSYLIPALHPKFSIGTDAAIHTRAFADVTDTTRAHRRTIQAAKALALTAIDVVCEPDLIEKIRNDHRTQKRIANT